MQSIVFIPYQGIRVPKADEKKKRNVQTSHVRAVTAEGAPPNKSMLIRRLLWMVCTDRGLNRVLPYCARGYHPHSPGEDPNSSIFARMNPYPIRTSHMV